MVMFCHGGPDGAGCCYVRGSVCPLRWELRNGHIFDASGGDLGSVETFITSTISNKPGRDRARDQLVGIKFACRAAIEVVANDAKLLTNRVAFEAAWHAHPDYVALVRPAWAIVEQNLGWPANSYNCGTWRGTGVPQCCFAEAATVNEARAASLSAAARALRQAGGT